ncbi:DUF6503 family protein [uncultured Aquimarina sp.]|uniref:DUF6503 family protein n=1 Tax=uncultured Aquimarina sp. TaxID=575652 RepID=UPI0026225E9F|nr:DUF6503 family protein [uncultured Aquimarina sp.]
MKRIFIVLLSIVMLSCNQKKEEKNKEPEATENKEPIPVEPDGGIGDGALSISNHFTKTIEKAHKKDKFLNHKAVSFYVNIIFNGKEHLDGKVTMLTNSSKIRIDKKDESKLIYDGENVYLCPADANDKGARFDMFTWTYFFGLPYKLSDPGTKLELQDDRMLNNTKHSTAKLTFEAGTGDAPDDWYIIYADPVAKSLQAAAYIVTFGSDGDTSKAEADPHAIHYKEFTTVDDIPFATKWEFYGWTSEKGMTDKLGEATITDITFLEKEGELFDDPENSKIID